MKRILLLITAIVCLPCFYMKAQAADELFPYPVPPDSMVHLQARCDYIISRFWQRCNFDLAMRNPDKFDKAFGAWIDMMPHASADTVHTAINNLLARFTKKGPETLALAGMARKHVWADSAEIRSDEIYEPFAKAAANNKKINKADRAIYARDARVIASSSIGAILPDLEFVQPDGSKNSTGKIKGSSILLFFYRPGDIDCIHARIRLAADLNTEELIDRGELVVVCINPEGDNEKWSQEAAKMPGQWISGTMSNADDYFDLRLNPQFMFLDKNRKVLVKNMDLNYLLGAFKIANKASKPQQSSNE